jgi:putative transposase
MARRARLIIPGVPLHVVQRANPGKTLFYTDEDRRRYLDFLGKYAAKQRLEIWAYCLMPDHVHLVAVPETDWSLSAVLAAIQLQHSKYIHRKHRRRGELWYDRFCSCPMDWPHTWEAVRFVETNPRRTGRTVRPERYMWSSAGGHAGLREDPLLSGNLEKRGKVKNWAKWLGKGEDEAMVATIRRCTLTGRPAGGPAFIARLEKIIGPLPKPGKVGRPRKVQPPKLPKKVKQTRKAGTKAKK